jgi:hypothetical protein
MLLTCYSELRELNEEIEGVGSIYCRIISLYAVAKYLNIDYVHIKCNIGHNYTNMDNNEWDDIYDNFFNLKKISKSINDYNLNEFNIIKKHCLLTEDLNYINTNNFYYVRSAYPITLQSNSDEYYSPIRNDLINAYEENNNNRELIYNKNKKNIAIHIRVYNDCDTSSYEGYLNYTCDRHKYNEEKYLSIINKLIDKYPDYDIHIFTQEKFKDRYPNINNNPIFNIHIDMDAISSLHHMIKADVLVLGFSCFSHLAGIYNKNTVYYIDYQVHKILNSWININEL